VKAAEALHQVQEGLHTTTGEPEKCAPDRPTKAAAHLELERVASTRTVTQGEALRALAERLRTPLFESGGTLEELSSMKQNQLQAEAAKLAEVFQPTCTGSEYPYRFFVLRALQTTSGRGSVRHRAAGDAVGHQRAARPLARRSLIGAEPRGPTRPTPLPPLVSLSGLCSLESAGQACAGTDGPGSGSRGRPASRGPCASPRRPCVRVSPATRG
jgi:hypothetical protein